MNNTMLNFGPGFNPADAVVLHAAEGGYVCGDLDLLTTIAESIGFVALAKGIAGLPPIYRSYWRDHDEQVLVIAKLEGGQFVLSVNPGVLNEDDTRTYMRADKRWSV